MTANADHRQPSGEVTHPRGHPPVMHTLFELCIHVSETRSFYSDVIGLTETLYNPEQGWLTYQAGQVQIVFTEAASATPPTRLEWSRSPGWDGGTLDASSWVFEVRPEAFDRLLQRLADRAVPFQTRSSEEGNLREVFVIDPTGRTVEVYTGDDDSAGLTG